MEKRIVINIIDHQISDSGKIKTSIVSSEIDLFKCPMGELFKIIHIAVAEGQKIIIQPSDSKSTTMILSGSLSAKTNGGL